jgi:rhodanese-related sulfurtransferase
MFYTLASERVSDLWAALRDVAAEHVAGIEKLSTAYLGDRREIEAITREELASRLQRRNVVVIDVRPSAEYAAGHIPGARSVPPDEVRRHLRTIPKDKEIVAYCRGPFCVYADDVVRSLQRRGVRARRLEDGFPEWKRAGHDIAVGEAGGV